MSLPPWLGSPTGKARCLAHGGLSPTPAFLLPRPAHTARGQPWLDPAVKGLLLWVFEASVAQAGLELLPQLPKGAGIKGVCPQERAAKCRLRGDRKQSPVLGEVTDACVRGRQGVTGNLVLGL